MTITIKLILFLFSVSLFSQGYYGAEYRTIESFKYGRFEVNYKAAKGSGILSNFFTYHDFTTGTADWNELDIEILGRYSDDIQLTTILPRQTIRNSHYKVDYDPREEFHTYAIEWTPDYVAWFIDGTEVYRQDGEYMSELVHGQKIMMNIWSSEWAPWVGEWSDEILPVYAWYDWVSYFEYTPGEGDYGTDNNFTFSWKDDFDSWDTERWEKATHGFPGNRVVFLPENVIFKDGYVLLTITKSGEEGLMDINPPTILWARAEGTKLRAEFSENVDSVTATNLSNYAISGATISDVKMVNERIVECTISTLNADQNYNLVIFNLKDKANPANTQTYFVKEIFQSKPLSFPVKINTGSDVAVYDYLPDQLWSQDVEYGHMDGYNTNYDTNIDVLGTDNDSLFYTGLDEVVKYKIRAPNGIYKVTLHIAEMWFSEEGQREFDVSIQGKRIVQDLDLIKDVGANTAYSVTEQAAEVTDGIIDIHFQNWTDRPLVNAIEVEQISTSLRDQSTLPESFYLKQNYPNPFNPATHIEFKLPEIADVELSVFDISGRSIKTLVNEKLNKGTHKFVFDAHSFSSGVYFYKVKVNGSGFQVNDVKKMVLMK